MVSEELSHDHAPQVVREFISSPPHWLLTQSPQALLDIDEIDDGEKAAISLALELHADLLLIDDLDGRRAAIQHGLKITGVIGVLLEASQKNLMNLSSTVELLQAAGLYLSKDLVSRLLEREE